MTPKDVKERVLEIVRETFHINETREWIPIIAADLIDRIEREIVIPDERRYTMCAICHSEGYAHPNPRDCTRSLAARVKALEEK